MTRDEILKEINEIDNLLLEAQERLEILLPKVCADEGENEDINEVVEHTLYEVECARDEEWTDLVELHLGNC